ncbi:hypothetical protein, partial [Escherichia coli]
RLNSVIITFSGFKSGTCQRYSGRVNQIKKASREERLPPCDKFKFASEDSKSVELSLNCRPDEAFSPHPATYLLYR